VWTEAQETNGASRQRHTRKKAKSDHRRLPHASGFGHTAALTLPSIRNRAPAVLPALLILPFAAALILALLPRAGRIASALTLGLAALAALGLLGAMAPAVFDGEIVRWRAEWLPQLGLAFSLRLDGFAFMFALVVLAIGALIVLYAAYYLAPDDPPARFFAYLALFMGAMLGVVLAGNLLLLVVFWELTSLASFLLIGFWRTRRDARAGARMALTITAMGGLALLAGVLLIGGIAGSYELDGVLAAGEAIRAHPHYLPALLLVLVGAFTKSAQFPFHFWLPHAMAAPTPVSAYLHSATMVKAGVFLLARLHPALAGSETWFHIVSGVGLATLVIGAALAIVQQDLKGLLAYSTISHLGLITLLFGLGEPLALVAGVFHILNHATFKASLFMAAGIIDHETGSRDFRKLNGLWKFMPITGALAIVASLAMAGVPLFNGFLSKEMFLAETLALETHAVYRILVPSFAVLAGILAVAYSLRFVHDVFFNGEPIGLAKTPHEPPRVMRVPVEVLVVLCLAVGLFPNFTIAGLLELGASGALMAPLPEYKLAIWHGFNLPLAMSAVSIVGGVLLYFGLQRGINLHRIERRSRGKRIFDWKLGGAIALAQRVTATLESGRLQSYLLLLVLTALMLGAAPFIDSAFATGTADRTPLHPAAMGLWLAIVAATIASVWLRRERVTTLILLGLVGLGVSLVFVLLAAPDLALTQLLVEVVSIILLLLALGYLPQRGREREEPRLRLARDAAIALAAGTAVAALVFAVLTRPFQSVSAYVLETTLAKAGGANAVNTIIVDYRGFDTLGEITVFGIAALIVYALLKGQELEALAPPPARGGAQRSLLLKTAAQLLLPFAFVISLHFFIRGHNAPGGGFIAALVLAVAFILQYVASGTRFTETRIGAAWPAFIGWGLLAAGVTGIGSFWFAHPFLTSSTPYVELPLIGPVPFASAMGFDLGVYLAVFGAAMLMLSMLGRLGAEAESPRKRTETP
jgi:multicomponent K+:H+ antiporter subunit A